MSHEFEDEETPLSAAALGVLITASTMSGGISINEITLRLNSSRKVIQDAMLELKSFGLIKTSTAHYGGRFVAQTEITQVGHTLVVEYLSALKKAYWGYMANS